MQLTFRRDFDFHVPGTVRVTRVYRAGETYTVSEFCARQAVAAGAAEWPEEPTPARRARRQEPDPPPPAEEARDGEEPAAG